MKKLSIYFLFLLCSAAAHAQLPSYLPTDGLVAWFPFTGNFIDSTGFGHDGTPYGTTPAKGRFGVPNTARRFNGTSDYIFIPAGVFVQEQSIDITASLTISAWVKSYNYLYSAQEQIYWRGNTLSAHDPHMLYFNGGEVRVRRDVDPGSTVREVGAPLAGLDTNYHLFTGTFDSATSMMCMYIDGKLKTKSYMPGLQTYPTATMYNYIGAVDGGTWQFFYGFIDELAIWRRALTPCEVAALYYSVPDIITGQPVNDTVMTGTAASFTVGVSAPSPVYQWQVNSGSGFTNLSAGTPYGGVNTPTLTISPTTPALSGNLYRCIVNSDSCLNKISTSAKLTVDTPLTVGFIAAGEQQIAVTPNPNTGIFTVEGLVAGHDATIEIMDITGRIVYSHKVSSTNSRINYEVKLDNRLRNGAYLLRVRSGSTQRVSRILLER